MQEKNSPASTSKSIEISGCEKSLGVSNRIWKQALDKVSIDPVANIKHTELYGEIKWRIHVAQISSKVTCHVHCNGD